MQPLVNLSSLIDDAKCHELVRQHRWPDGIRCPAGRLGGRLEQRERAIHVFARVAARHVQAQPLVVPQLAHL